MRSTTVTPQTGLLLVHFVEDPEGHGERVFFSLADDGDPTGWTRLNGGEPVLESRIGTTGARDPHIVRHDAGFTVVATDLRVFGAGPMRWDEWTRTGSRSILAWRSPDLVAWSGPALLEVAPPEAGMAWAPEIDWDAAAREHVLTWSSTLYAADDPDHRGASYSRILGARTDLRRVTDRAVVLDRGTPVIDFRGYEVHGRTVRFAKEEPGPDSLGVFQEVSGEDGRFHLVASGIGTDRHTRVEAPMLVEDPARHRWLLLIDQYDRMPQGFVAYASADPFSGEWTALPEEEFRMPPGTKHGGILPLVGDEPERLRHAFG